MKKIILVYILLLASNFVNSQIYYSHYLDETSEWRIMERHGEAAYQNLTFCTIFLNGFENINGYSYYKMYQTYYNIGYDVDYSTVIYPQSSNITRFIGYLREDANGKFYLFGNGTTPFSTMGLSFNPSVETEYFDNQTVINAQVGDIYFNDFNNPCQVASVSTLSINSESYKLILSSTFESGKSLEGVGKIFDYCNSSYNLDGSLAYFNRIHCYTKQGQTYSFYNDYHLPNFASIDCNTFPIANRQSLQTTTFNKPEVSILPNPTNALVTISSLNQIYSVKVYDLQGRLLQTKIVNGLETTFDASNLRQGNYLFQVATEKSIVTKKIIRQ